MRYRKLLLVGAVLGLALIVMAPIQGHTKWNPLKWIISKIHDHEERLDNLEQQSSAGGIRVIDANDQFLGLLVEGFGYQQRIFVPHLKGIFIIELETGDMVNDHIEYETTDCTDTGYFVRPELNRIPDGAGGYRYYRAINERVPYVGRSQRNSATGECEEFSQPQDTAGFRVVEIPGADIQLDLPAALPVSFE